jgi:uncharacterized membrane protein HdeD (DUF308 family)
MIARHGLGLVANITNVDGKGRRTMSNVTNIVPGVDVRVALREHWRFFLMEGIILVILGSAAILVPPLASLAVAIFLGWLFLIGGIVGLVSTIASRRTPGFWWSLISAIVTIIAGFVLIGWPISGTISLTFVLTAFLVADGILMIFFALEHQRQFSANWGWLLANGIIDLVLAGLIVWALPTSAIWALGLIVGIDLMFGGWPLISMAFAVRKPVAS